MQSVAKCDYKTTMTNDIESTTHQFKHIVSKIQQEEHIEYEI